LVNKALQDFKTYLETAEDRSPNTVRAYLSDLHQFASWFTQTNGQEISSQIVISLDVRDYRQYLLATKRRKASTVNRHLASITTWLAWAMQTGQIDRNPAQDVNGVAGAALAPLWLSKQDEGALLRQVEREVQSAQTDPARRQALRNRALVVLILNTGLRADEACGLEIPDLAISEREGELLVRQGKGRKQRLVPLNKQARQAVGDWLAVRPEAAGPQVFLGQRNEVLSTSGLRRVVSAAAHGAKLDPDKVSPHKLRHTFAKRLVDAGVSLEKVAALLGHSNLNTTRIYLAPGQQDLENAVRVLEY
jgi:site-specific recombinase XerD